MIKLGELFCGPGGFAEGAKKAKGFKHVWANDIHEDSCKTFEKHHPGCKVVAGDVYEEFIGKEMRKMSKNIDGLLFGFPCNDFSIVGKKRGLSGKYGPLYKAACEVLDYFKPKFFVAENVSSIVGKNEVFNNFTKIMRDLARCSDKGYKIFANKYKFEDYGIPQTRHRQILVGYRGDISKKNENPLKKLEENISKITCKIALEKGVPGTIQNNKSLMKSENKELTNHSDDVLKRLKNTKEGQNVWQINDKFGLPNVKSARMSHIYKKLDSSKPSYTVTGSGGGGTHVYHYKYDRALTNRERARLQTFDDDYDFLGNKESVRRQIGMAVPVLAAKKILLEVKKSLDRKKKLNTYHDFIIEPFGQKLKFNSSE